MTESHDRDKTGAYQPEDSVDAVLDAGLAAAFRPGPPLSSESWSLPSRSGPGAGEPPVQLREPVDEPLTPVNLPASDAMPAPVAVPERYHLVGELARGGMGAILKGRDVDLGRDIALKVLLEKHAGKPELLHRFVEEAQIAGQLQHPGVVPVYELGQFGDARPYFTMKLVKGQTLAKLLAERTDSSQERPRFVKIFEQVCQTLAYVHARGVIHRDLKPSNVMVGSFGEVQVMDWGLAKVLAEGGIADEQASRKRQPPEPVSVIRTIRSEGTELPGVGSSHTRVGSVLGTPAYMAPEQARGEVELVDQRADVFGLGAILCEILTGRPPFTGKGAEAQRKAQTASLDDAYDRLAQSGADAELIALARSCLAAEPWDRPRDAGVVAEQMTAYLESVQARLRQAELERAAAEARAEEETHTRQLAEAKAAEERKRRRATLALAAAVLALVVLGGSGAAWWWQQRTEMVQDVERALAEAAEHQQAGRWAEVRATLERAEGRLGSGGPAALRQQVRQARANAEMVAELDEIRLQQAAVKEGRFDMHGANERYAEAFRKYGIDMASLEVETAAERVRESAIRKELLAALDNWAWAEPGKDPGQAQLRAVADGADANPWRRMFREARRDRAKLKELAGQVEALEQLPAVLSLFGAALVQAGLAEEGVAILRQAQQRYPADFWINQELALYLVHLKPPRLDEAIGYYRAAVALRPSSPGAQLNLGTALHDQRDFAGARVCFRKAIELAPKYAQAHGSLGNALRDQGDLIGATACYRKAIELDPKLAKEHNNLGITLADQGDLAGAGAYIRKAIELAPKDAMAHCNLGSVLKNQGDLTGASACYRAAIELDPKRATAHNLLGIVLARQGDLVGASACFRKAIELDPKNAMAHNNLGLILRDQGDLAGASACYRKAIELDPKYDVAHYNLGNALMYQGDLAGASACYRKAIELDPKHGGAHNNLGIVLTRQRDLVGASAYIRKAIELDPKDAMAHNNLGLILKDQGNLAGASAAYRQAISLKPDYAEAHCNLAHVLTRQGEFAAALAAWQKGHELGSKQQGWRYPSAEWVRQAQRQVELDTKLSAILNGKQAPASAAERLEYAQLCAYKQLFAVSARFFADALVEQPQLADDLKSSHRYDAACSAALASSGQGQDADKLDAEERTRWRQQALDWLRADLAQWTKQLESGKPEDRKQVQAKLQHWQKDHDLTSVRDAEALTRLSADEQEAWKKLWADVTDMLKMAMESAR